MDPASQPPAVRSPRKSRLPNEGRCARRAGLAAVMALALGCSSHDTTPASSQTQQELADGSADPTTGFPPGVPVRGPGTPPAEAMLEQQNAEAGAACKAPSSIPAYDGGLFTAVCERRTPLIICEGFDDGGLSCVNACPPPGNYTLICQGQPDPSLGCKVLSLPGISELQYCCPCQE
jgi:hypothetical protein